MRLFCLLSLLLCMSLTVGCSDQVDKDPLAVTDAEGAAQQQENAEGDGVTDKVPDSTNIENKPENPTPGEPAAEAMTIEGLQLALKKQNPDYQGEGKIQQDGGEIVYVDLSGTNVTDIAPLKGLKLRMFGINQTKISDISVLKGMPLEVFSAAVSEISDLSPLEGSKLMLLDIQQTKVTDLSPIRDCPLEELYLEKTKVKEIRLTQKTLKKLYISESEVSSLKGLEGQPIEEINALGAGLDNIDALKGAPVKMIWLSFTKVKDIAPMVNDYLVSATLEGCPVSDLSPLKGSRIQRLHIGNTQVTDLTPIVGLQLTRLIFNPDKIKTGLNEIVKMPSLQELGTDFEGRMRPAEFWGKHLPKPAGPERKPSPSSSEPKEPAEKTKEEDSDKPK